MPDLPTLPPQSVTCRNSTDPIDPTDLPDRPTYPTAPEHSGKLMHVDLPRVV